MKMKSIRGLGLGLSLVFGCLLLAFIAEIYYLLWWKKKIITKIDESGSQVPPKTSIFFYIFCCWKNPNSTSSSSSAAATAQHMCTNSSPTLVHEPQSSSTSDKDSWLKQENSSMEYFPRFLFTITEETKEDLERENGVFKNRRNNLSELLQILETPFLTPLASPPYFTPPLTPSFSDHQNSSAHFLESEKDAEFIRSLRSSPPPKMKFLRDAEEKMIVQRRKILMGNEGNGQFITLNINVVENQENGRNFQNCSSSSSSNLQRDVATGNPHVNFNVC